MAQPANEKSDEPYASKRSRNQSALQRFIRLRYKENRPKFESRRSSETFIVRLRTASRVSVRLLIKKAATGNQDKGNDNWDGGEVTDGDDFKRFGTNRFLARFAANQEILCTPRSMFLRSPSSE
jgi:hypothetical protein